MILIKLILIKNFVETLCGIEFQEDRSQKGDTNMICMKCFITSAKHVS